MGNGFIGRGKGAVVGSAIGAGGMAGSQLVMHGKQVWIPAETKLDFDLNEPLDVTANP